MMVSSQIRTPRSFRVFAAIALVAVALVSLPSTARAQDVMTKESVATLKAAFVADVTTMQDKFLGLANAFPQDKYTWKPMDGGGSGAEALMLAAFEGYNC